MTVPPWAFLTRLKSPRSARTKARRRWGPISTLKGVLGGRRRRPRGTCRWRRGRAAPGAGRAGRRGRRGRSRAGWSRARAARRASRSRSVGSGRGAHFGGRAGGWSRLLLEVEEDGGDVDAGDAVDERVVALADDREAVAVEPLDQPQLPERLGAVELLGEDPRREVAQLLLGARRRQRGVAHVVVEVEEGVVDPDRPALARRGRSAASGGSAAPGAGATRCGRGTPRGWAARPRR